MRNSVDAINDPLMLRSALGRVSKHAKTPMQGLLARRRQFLHKL
jgi:hypothetical protein